MQMCRHKNPTSVGASRACVYTPTTRNPTEIWAVAQTHKKENQMKDKFINFRATEKEKKQLATLAKKAKISQADFIRHSVFNKEIIVIDGLKPLQKELK